MQRKSVFIVFFAVLVFSCQNNADEQASGKRSPHPNIIYILADDLGYGDISAFNPEGKIRTQHIDQLASNGITFTDAHSNSSVCTPTRYGVLTGRYAFRGTLKKGVTWSYDDPIIPLERLTVANYLKTKGYKTACIGKWHLGMVWERDPDNGEVDFMAPIKGGPNDLGFDYFFGIAASLDIPPYLYIRNEKVTANKIDTIPENPLPAFWREGPIGDDFKHYEVLPRLTQEALGYIEESAQHADPFFLYFPLPAPHTPILPTSEFEGVSNLSSYGDFVLMVDDLVGQVVQKLEELGIEENTMVVFTSDNGFAPYADVEAHESMGHFPSYHFRGYKADLYEGGHRIPFIVQWPENISPGRTSHEPICLTDFLATCADLFDEKVPDNAGEDSFSLLPVLQSDNHPSPIRGAIVHHSVHGEFSIRKDQYKLVFSGGSGGWSYPTPSEVEKGEYPPLQLYNLDQDPAEQNNLYEEETDRVESLVSLMGQFIKNGRSTPGIAQTHEGDSLIWRKN